MRTWLDVESTVRDELVALDGPGNRRLDACGTCGSDQVTPLYRCLECSYGILRCSECVLKSHTELPLHRLEVCLISYLSFYAHYTQCWKDGFFDRASLNSLGYVFHLGHGGEVCPADSSPSQLTIIDANGWHKLYVRYCKCGASGVSHEHYRQLLRERWYPASINRPKTAFTIDLLETYHKHALQGKLNLYDFYHTTMQKADNQGRSKPLASSFHDRSHSLLTRSPTVPLS